MIETLLMPTLLVLANVLGTGMIVPQVVRLKRRADGDGISATWVGVGIAMNVWWLVYGLQASLWGLIPVSGIALILYCIMAGQLLSLFGRSVARPLLAGMVGIALIPGSFLALGGWSAAGVAIGLCYGIQFAPAAIASVRSSQLSGISPTTWTMAWAEAVIWLIYGLSIGDVALTVGGAGGTAMSTVILFRLATVALARSKVLLDGEPVPAVGGR